MAKDKRLRLRDNGGGAPPETFAQVSFSSASHSAAPIH